MTVAAMIDTHAIGTTATTATATHDGGVSITGAGLTITPTSVSITNTTTPTATKGTTTLAFTDQIGLLKKSSKNKNMNDTNDIMSTDNKVKALNHLILEVEEGGGTLIER
jgi:hypothetical protein